VSSLDVFFGFIANELIDRYVIDSAKLTDENEITPQSNYVTIFANGSCFWEPRYELSITQCPVDVTWFPFDRQVCNLVFESWSLDQHALNLSTDNDSLNLNNFLPPDDWTLLGTILLEAKFLH